MYRWDTDGPARLELESLPASVGRALSPFMEAVVIVDPMEYQRRPGEPLSHVRTLAFGPHGQGLVTFLVYPPDELVLVVRIQWLGE